MRDALGNIRTVTDSSGNPLESRLYSPYGETYGTTGSSQTTYGYTGEPTDATGMVYLRARYVNPTIGQFINLDPAETPNRFAYVNGNPVNKTDHTGLRVEEGSGPGIFQTPKYHLDTVHRTCTLASSGYTYGECQSRLAALHIPDVIKQVTVPASDASHQPSDASHQPIGSYGSASRGTYISPSSGVRATTASDASHGSLAGGGVRGGTSPYMGSYRIFAPTQQQGTRNDVAPSSYSCSDGLQMRRGAVLNCRGPVWAISVYSPGCKSLISVQHTILRISQGPLQSPNGVVTGFIAGRSMEYIHYGPESCPPGSGPCVQGIIDTPNMQSSEYVETTAAMVCGDCPMASYLFAAGCNKPGSNEVEWVRRAIERLIELSAPNPEPEAQEGGQPQLLPAPVQIEIPFEAGVPGMDSALPFHEGHAGYEIP